MSKEKILITGACGQLATELAELLRNNYGEANVLATDIRQPAGDYPAGPFEILDVLDEKRLRELINKYQITQIYHLAAILSANGEKNPLQTWDINMRSMLYVFEAARELKLSKVYWPSTIAVFGPDTIVDETPQKAYTVPTSVYGISKRAGEYWCNYYFNRYGTDIRSLRYPGVIGYKSPPGGGTTDYAVDIYFKAVAGENFTSFLSEDTYLPMIYMPDALRATLELMEADAAKIKVRTSYNLSSMSFSPKKVYESILKVMPDFKIKYEPDFRQKIADSWPHSIDDSAARQDWNWKEAFDLDAMTADMIMNLRKMQASVHK